MARTITASKKPFSPVPVPACRCCWCPTTSILFALALTLLGTISSNTVTASTTIIFNGSTGALNRGLSRLPTPSGGVVALLSNPSSESEYFDDDENAAGSVYVSSSSDCVTVHAPGATLSSSSSSGSSELLNRGVGSAAAASVAGAVVLTGVTAADCKSVDSCSILDTRHGRTLSSVFAHRVNRITSNSNGNAEDDASSEEDNSGGDADNNDKTILILAVEGAGDEGLSEEDQKGVESDISKMFDACVIAAEDGDETLSSDVTVNDYYDIQIMMVNSKQDAAEIITTAVAAGARSPLTSSAADVVERVRDAISSATPALASYAPAVARECILCEDAYVRHGRAARAKLAAWRGRVVGRALPIDRFGVLAENLLTRTLDAYDKDTLAAAASAVVAPIRAERRTQLARSLEQRVRDLFAGQVENLGQSTLTKFRAVLLRQSAKQQQKQPPQPNDPQQEYDDNAAAVRAAAFAFDTAMTDLEVPSLSLKKDRYTQDMSGMLNDALRDFPDSVLAQLQNLKRVQKRASKPPPKKKERSRSIDVGLALVAMIRPDGFGNLQGYAGYTAGSNNVVVGVHNDADAPETISQFGGSRPPLLRVQPKLNLDVDL